MFRIYKVRSDFNRAATREFCKRLCRYLFNAGLALVFHQDCIDGTLFIYQTVYFIHY